VVDQAKSHSVKPTISSEKVFSDSLVGEEVDYGFNGLPANSIITIREEQ
jgi:hypothetical protein